jgi:hypothetical protein
MKNTQTEAYQDEKSMRIPSLLIISIYLLQMIIYA